MRGFMRKTPKAVTIQVVAKAAGVSISTVSRVLNGKDDVSVETIEKVKSVIEELNYVSSLAARGMRSHHTNLIGLIVPDITTPYCASIMRGVNRVISKLDKDLLIYTGGGGNKENIARHERSCVALLNGGVADGVVVVTPTATQFASTAPVVIIDPNNESPDLPAISATNREGALAAMNYLIGLGHRRIGFITGRMELVSANQRLQGYKDGLAAAGIPIEDELIEIGDYTLNRAYICTKNLISLENRPPAIFAGNDMAASGVYQAAKEAGLQIPNDLSVIGFDNLSDASLMVPALTTVDQHVEDIGSIATQMVVKLINGEPLPESIPDTVSFTRDRNLFRIPTELVIRDSCSTIS
jgi:LacI family transcriptional regulator